MMSLLRLLISDLLRFPHSLVSLKIPGRVSGTPQNPCVLASWESRRHEACSFQSHALVLGAGFGLSVLSHPLSFSLVLGSNPQPGQC